MDDFITQGREFQHPLYQAAVVVKFREFPDQPSHGPVLNVLACQADGQGVADSKLEKFVGVAEINPQTFLDELERYNGSVYLG